MQIKELLKDERGFAVSVITFFVLLVMVSIALGMASLIFYRQKISTNTLKSTQSYYAAESALEDALLRLKDNPLMSAGNYAVTLNGATGSVTIPGIVGGSRTVAAQGVNANITRKAQAVFSIEGEGVAFHYGAQVGAGGLTMGSNSIINGNVVSAGNISGSGEITGDVVVSGSGNSIRDVQVGGNVLAYSCISPATVAGNLTYVTGGSHTCTVSGTQTAQSSQIPSTPLPISASQITEWKDQASVGTSKSSYTIGSNQTVTEAEGVVITGNMTVGSNATWNLKGPTKIIGNLTLGSNSRLNLSSNLYVTGTIGFGSNSTAQLDSNYGSQSGVIIADGTISVNSNATLQGSGQSGSYVLILSTSTSSSAIGIGSNSTGAIFYTSAGGIQVNSNASVREVTGYRLSVGSNASVTYESGLANVFFSTGPGGTWSVESWSEQ